MVSAPSLSDETTALNGIINVPHHVHFVENGHCNWWFSLACKFEGNQKKEHAFTRPPNLDQVNKAPAVDDISSVMGTEVMREL